MSLFVLHCTDRPDSVALRVATREAHLAYLEGLGARVKLGGPMLDEASGASIGSLLIVEADDIAAARNLAADDPYARAGLFDAVDVTPWRLVVGGFEAP